MVEPSNQSSLGARFRAGGWEEKPLQVAGAINTYTARLTTTTVDCRVRSRMHRISQQLRMAESHVGNRRLRKTSDSIACKFRVCLLDLNWTHLQDRSETRCPLSATYRIGCTPPMKGWGWH